MVTGLWYTHDLTFVSLSSFWRCKEHPCPLSPYLGLWRMLEVPNWGLACWSWFGYGQWPLIHPCSVFGPSSWFWRCKEHPCPLSPYLGLLRMLEVPGWDFDHDSWWAMPWCTFLEVFVCLSQESAQISFQHNSENMLYPGGWVWPGLGLTLAWFS